MITVEENLVKEANIEGKQYIYHYELLQNDIYFSSECDKVKVISYGIGIEREDFIDGKLVGKNKNYIKNVSPRKVKVKKLLKILYDNIVSPIHLVDILGEYVDNYVLDYDNVLKENL